MNKIIVLLIIFIVGISCSKKEEEKEEKWNQKADWMISCLRWFDRDLYFANSDSVNQDLNNTFHQNFIKETLKSIEDNSYLGGDYFRYRIKNSSLLNPVRDVQQDPKSYSSFILIWPDQMFYDFAKKHFGGVNYLVDKNAMTIVSSENKRKYYIILKAGCFKTKEAAATCDNITIKGSSALVARQIGFIAGLPPADCVSDPSNIMCVEANDNQWNDESRKNFYNNLSSKLITIERNSNYYNDGIDFKSCLSRPWMDQEINVGSPNGENNIIFNVDQVFSALDEISCNTLLGCGYFSKKVVSQSSIPIYSEKIQLEKQEKSYMLIYPDLNFNNLVNENEKNIPDPNALTVVNMAYKRNFLFLFKNSCFSVNHELCRGAGSGISPNGGLQAIVARQVGSLVGIPIVNCFDFPTDVMCAEAPSDQQWSFENKNKFFRKFNNYLELIGNNPDFYKEYVIKNEEDSK